MRKKELPSRLDTSGNIYCNDCKRYQAPSAFYRRSKSKDGRHSICKTCDAIRGASEQKRRVANIRRERVKFTALAGYGGICVCCGEDEADLLCLDHVNDDGAASDIQILCYNCNLGKSIAGGVCPHMRKKT